MLEGHFILTSGLRSPVFLQKARVFMHADKTEILCRALAEKIRAEVPGTHRLCRRPGHRRPHPGLRDVAPSRRARRLGRARGRRLPAAPLRDREPGARVVIVEDIVTTGLSIRETIECLRAIGADVVAAACIIDRSAGKTDVGVPLVALAEYEVPAYRADALPPELAAIPAVKPGSRNI